MSGDEGGWHGRNVPGLTEPVVIPCVYVSGVSVLVADAVVRFVGWVELPPLGGETEERRVVERFVMTKDAAQQFCDDLVRLFLRT